MCTYSDYVTGLQPLQSSAERPLVCRAQKGHFQSCCTYGLWCSSGPSWHEGTNAASSIAEEEKGGGDHLRRVAPGVDGPIHRSDRECVQVSVAHAVGAWPRPTIRAVVRTGGVGRGERGKHDRHRQHTVVAAFLAGPHAVLPPKGPPYTPARTGDVNNGWAGKCAWSSRRRVKRQSHGLSHRDGRVNCVTLLLSYEYRNLRFLP